MGIAARIEEAMGIARSEEAMGIARLEEPMSIARLEEAMHGYCHVRGLLPG